MSSKLAVPSLCSGKHLFGYRNLSEQIDEELYKFPELKTLMRRIVKALLGRAGLSYFNMIKINF